MKILEESGYYALGFSLVLCFWILPICAAAQAQQPAILVIEGGTLIDGNGGTPVPDALIIIRGNKIETVSRKGQASPPAGAQVLRAEGKFIIPGLIDAHCHYYWFMGELYLAHGVTSIVEVGGGEELGIAQREAINRGKVKGARTFIAVGSGSGRTSAEQRLTTGLETPLSLRQVFRTPEQAREMAKRFIAAGADMLKVHDGVAPLEVNRAFFEEAHKAGLPVVSRSVGTNMYAREAILAGADMLEHAAGIGISVAKDPAKWKGYIGLDLDPFVDMDEAKAAELIQLMVQRKVASEPDFYNKKGLPKDWARFEAEDRKLFSNPALAYYPQERIENILMNYRPRNLERSVWERKQKAYQNGLRFHRQLVQAGGKVLVGSDAGSNSTPGLGVHHEMEILVEEAGLTPMQVIQGATRWPAETLRILDRLGTIEAGKLADLVIVNQDPLQNIRNLQKIEWVIQDGRIVDRTYNPWFTSPFSAMGPVGAPIVEGLAWVAALKQTTLYREEAGEGEGEPARLPPPGVESISPIMVTEGNPTLTLTIKGFNFFSRSLVYLDSEPVPARRVSGTELQVTVDSSFLRRAHRYSIVVKNPGPRANPEWGDNSSNKAYLQVDFRY